MMRGLLTGLTGLCLALAPALGAQIPREAPELTISLSNGKQMRLSQYKGKVIALEFLLTTCPGCKRASSAMQKLYEELGSKGFQPLGAAINEEATPQLPAYARELRLTYPIGAVDRSSAINFLQHPIMLRMMMPQLVIIDKKGAIRAQYPGTDSFFRNEEENMRKVLMPLLSE